jgi:hypothetical protein
VSIPKATHTGTLFDGLLDCYVLDDERRMITNRGTVQLLNGSGAEGGNLGRYTGRLPQKYSHLAAGPEIEFSLPGGRKAKGHEATWLVDLLKAYDEADDEGLLHHTQRGLAKNARRVLRALAGVGIIALIDEATEYQRVRDVENLSFTFRAILLDRYADWDLMWTPDFVEQMCRLHRQPFDGTQPRFIASTYEKLYRLILTDEVYEELKRRNPEPSFGTNHHQWLTPEARTVVGRQIPILTALAETCDNKEAFWAFVEHKYAKRPLQMSWVGPVRTKPEHAA